MWMKAKDENEISGETKNIATRPKSRLTHRWELIALWDASWSTVNITKIAAALAAMVAAAGRLRVIAAAVDAPNTASAATKIATMGQERAGTRSPGSGRACRDRVGADGDSSAVVAIRSPSSMLIGRGHATNRDSSRQGTPGPSPCALRTHPAGGNPVGMGFSLT